MQNYYFRRDELVTDPMGHPVMGVRIWLCQQPCTPGQFGQVPTPLAQVYADAAGINPLDQITPGQQLVTDQNGECSYYSAHGVYTVVYYSTQIATPTQELVLSDQVIAGTGNFQIDSVGQGIQPSPDGIGRAFNLSRIPNPASSLVVSVNGLLEVGYTVVFATVSLLVAPPRNASIVAKYQF